MESRDRKSRPAVLGELGPVFDIAAMLRRADEDARSKGFASATELEEHERAAEQAAAAEERRQNARKRRARICEQAKGRITDEIRDTIVEGLPMVDNDAWRTVRDWLASDQPALLLAGPTGSGKTVAAVRALAASTGSTQFVRALRIGAHYERWSSDREDKVTALDLDVALLVLDDLGQEPLEDRRSIPALEEIVDARQSKRTRTIYTTNLTAEQYGARYSDRMRSRLFQAAGVLTTIVSTDLRRAR